ncbi:phospholipase A1-II 5 [Elaeis guineensis]|uniref:phospholipase A1-II 5 n=1 Tax=Elaeis guineensis var. tenera TaxID=51953 RepID=UPI003C6D2ADA
MAKDGAATPSRQELLGSNHWAGLLDPLDLSLRRLLLQCGDLCQVTYDSFNSDKHSKYCGSCRYSKSTLLNKVFFPSAADFSVVDYLYATSQIGLPDDFLLFPICDEAWSKDSNWIGYIAVSSDAAALKNGRREIYVAWRGTIRPLEWVDVAMPQLVPIDSILSSTQRCWAHDDEVPKVMKGWYIIYTSSDPQSPFNKQSARDQLLPKIKQLVERYKNESVSIICVGHSLGASLATLSAFDIVENGLSKIGENNHAQVCAMVFGSPQIGNKAFKDRLERLPNLRVLHTKNKIDLIPQYPSGLLGYVFAGVELVVDTRKSPYLKDSTNTGDWHNLQGILQAVAGWNGEDGEFKFQVERSIALVNKSCDYLKDEYLIPGLWWVEKNKGMVLEEDGEWYLAPPAAEDLPLPPSSFKADGDAVSTPAVTDGKQVSIKKRKSVSVD